MVIAKCFLGTVPTVVFGASFFVKKLFNAFVHQGMRLAVVTQNTLQLISLMMKFDKIRA